MHLGEFDLALEHFEKALLLYDPERHRDDAFRYSQNSGVACAVPCRLGIVVSRPARSGFGPDRGSPGLARELSEPHGLAHALFFAAILHQLRREERMAQERAEAAIAVSGEHGLVLYQAMATITRGWALIEQGQQEEAIEQIRQGLAAHQATGTELLRPHFLALLAEALGKAGQTEEGLRVLEEALAMAHRNGERYYQAELYRLKGELLLMSSKDATADAESCFKRAIEIARKLKAKSLELRAAMSLSRFYQSRNQQEKAQGLVSQVYGSFTEGFETRDLREARALIEELA